MWPRTPYGPHSYSSYYLVSVRITSPAHGLRRTTYKPFKVCANTRWYSVGALHFVSPYTEDIRPRDTTESVSSTLRRIAYRTRCCICSNRLGTIRMTCSTNCSLENSKSGCGCFNLSTERRSSRSQEKSMIVIGRCANILCQITSTKIYVLQGCELRHYKGPAGAGIYQCYTIILPHFSVSLFSKSGCGCFHSFTGTRSGEAHIDVI